MKAKIVFSVNQIDRLLSSDLRPNVLLTEELKVGRLSANPKVYSEPPPYDGQSTKPTLMAVSTDHPFLVRCWLKNKISYLCKHETM